MASEFTEKCFHRYFNETETSLRTIIDAELQEVRDLLTDIAALETDGDDEYQIGQRTRTLMGKLEVRP